MNPIINKLNEISSRETYLNKYGSDLVISILIIIVAVGIYLYYQAKNTMTSLKEDWEKNRCSPFILPFAGYINIPPEDDNLTAWSYTAKNFEKCLSTETFSFVKTLTAPFEASLAGVAGIFDSTKDGIESIHGLIGVLRNVVKSIFSFVFGLLQVLINIVKQITTGIGNVFYKAMLIFYVGILIVQTSIFQMSAAIGAIINTILALIGALTLVMIIVAIIIALGPWNPYWPVAWALGIALVIYMVVAGVAVQQLVIIKDALSLINKSSKKY